MLKTLQCDTFYIFMSEVIFNIGWKLNFIHATAVFHHSLSTLRTISIRHRCSQGNIKLCNRQEIKGGSNGKLSLQCNYDRSQQSGKARRHVAIPGRLSGREGRLYHNQFVRCPPPSPGIWHVTEEETQYLTKYSQATIQLSIEMAYIAHKMSRKRYFPSGVITIIIFLITSHEQWIETVTRICIPYLIFCFISIYKSNHHRGLSKIGFEWLLFSNAFACMNGVIYIASNKTVWKVYTPGHVNEKLKDMHKIFFHN